MKEVTGKVAVSRARTRDTLVDGWSASELTRMEELFPFVVRYE